MNLGWIEELDAIDSDLMTEITTALPIEKLHRVSSNDVYNADDTWSITSTGALFYEGRIYTPVEAARNHMIRLQHDGPFSGASSASGSGSCSPDYDSSCSRAWLYLI